MKKGGVHAVVVGSDRIAANGDVANKIGTYMVASSQNVTAFLLCGGAAFHVDLNCPRAKKSPSRNATFASHHMKDISLH